MSIASKEIRYMPGNSGCIQRALYGFVLHIEPHFLFRHNIDDGWSFFSNLSENDLSCCCGCVFFEPLW